MSIELKPCPFCGGSDFEIVENGRIWSGMKYSEPVSVSVRHWCPAAPGQPSRMIERVGRDEASAVTAWNTRHTLSQQPATGEPVQADSSGHLRVIASLGAALRRLSFAAQTTGGTDGPDAELQSAIGQAEQALSLGGIWQAMSATAEPVVSRNPFASRCYAMSESHLSGHRLIVGFEKLGDVQDAHEWVARQGRGDFTHPAPSVPGDDFDLICNAIDKADSITMEGDYMLDSDDCIAVVRVMQVLLSVRAAMLAAAQAQKGGA